MTPYAPDADISQMIGRLPIYLTGTEIQVGVLDYTQFIFCGRNPMPQPFFFVIQSAVEQCVTVWTVLPPVQ